MDELRDEIDLSCWRVRELPPDFADQVLVRLDQLDRELADELAVIDAELDDELLAIDHQPDTVTVRPRAIGLARPSNTPIVLGIVLAAAAAALVWMWPEPPPPPVLPIPAPVAAPTLAPQPADLDRGGIRRAVTEQFIPEARRCYGELLGREPAAEGRVTLHFGVIRDGDRGVVDRCEVLTAQSEIADARFHGCLVTAMKAVIFEAPTGEGRVQITYPIVFRPAGARADDDPAGVIAP